MKRIPDPIRHLFSVLMLLSVLGGVAGTRASAAPVAFGTPPWPGLKVKTEVAEQLLQTLGYQTTTKKLGVPFIYRDLASGQLDAYLGAWMPTEKQMLTPLADKHKVVNLGANLKGATMGLAVPDYVWQSGIHSIRDLTAHADRFDEKVYGIESGSEINNDVTKAIKQNDDGMGRFHLVASSTAVMLTQVQRAISRHRPIVFIGWRPHWMNIQFKMRYLKGRANSPIARTRSTVLTIVSRNLAASRPNVRKLLSRIHVDPETQSRWINEYSYKKVALKTVARQWLATHPGVVSTWLDGVTTKSGGSAEHAYRRSFTSQS